MGAQQGWSYEREVFVHYLLNMVDDPIGIDAVQQTVAGCQPLDDVVVRRRDGSEHRIQCKHSNQSNPVLDVDYLEQNLGGWLRALPEKGDGVVFSPRVPDSVLAPALSENRLVLSSLDRATRKRIKDACPGLTDLPARLSRFVFRLGQADLEAMTRQNAQRISALGAADAEGEFRRHVTAWAQHKGSPPPDGWVRVHDVRQALRLDAAPMQQEFQATQDYVEAASGLEDRIRRWMADTPEGVLLVTGPAGCGKSTLLDRIVRDTPNIVVRHHFYLGDGGQSRLNPNRFQSTAILASLTRQLASKAGLALRERDGEMRTYLQRAAAKKLGPITIVIDGLDGAVLTEMREPALAHLLRACRNGQTPVHLIIGMQPQVRASLPEDIVVDSQELPVEGLDLAAVDQFLELKSARAPEAFRWRPAHSYWATFVKDVFTASRGHPLVLETAFEECRRRGAEFDARSLAGVDAAKPLQSYVEVTLRRSTKEARFLVQAASQSPAPLAPTLLHRYLEQSPQQTHEALQQNGHLLRTTDKAIHFIHPGIQEIVRSSAPAFNVNAGLARLLAAHQTSPVPESWAHMPLIQLALGHPPLTAVNRRHVLQWVAEGRNPARVTEMLLFAAKSALNPNGNRVDWNAFVELGGLHDYVDNSGSLFDSTLNLMWLANRMMSPSRPDLQGPPAEAGRDAFAQHARALAWLEQQPDPQSWKRFAELHDEETRLHERERTASFQTGAALVPANDVKRTTKWDLNPVATVVCARTLLGRGLADAAHELVETHKVPAPGLVVDLAVTGHKIPQGLLDRCDPCWPAILNACAVTSLPSPAVPTVIPSWPAKRGEEQPEEAAASWQRLFWTAAARQLQGHNAPWECGLPPPLAAGCFEAAALLARSLRGEASWNEFVEALGKGYPMRRYKTRFEDPVGEGYYLAADEILTAAARLLEKSGCIKSWDADYTVFAFPVVRAEAASYWSPIPTEVARKCVAFLEKESRPDGSLQDVAENLACAAVVAARHGDEAVAKRLLAKSARYLVSYGNHKDMFLLIVLECLDILAMQDRDNAFSLADRLVPALLNPRKFTDGDETRHLPEDYAEFLAKRYGRPALLLAQSQDKAGDHDGALETLTLFVKHCDLEDANNLSIAVSLPASQIRSALGHRQDAAAKRILATLPPMAEKSSGNKADDEDERLPAEILPQEVIAYIEAKSEFKRPYPGDWVEWIRHHRHADGLGLVLDEAIRRRLADKSGIVAYEAATRRNDASSREALVSALVEENAWSRFYVADRVKARLREIVAAEKRAQQHAIFVESNPANRSRYSFRRLVTGSLSEYAKFLDDTTRQEDIAELATAAVDFAVWLVEPAELPPPVPDA